MKKILIPIDFGETLTTVYEFVEKLAEKSPISVTLLHVLDFPVAPGNYLQPGDYANEFYDRFRKVQAGHLQEAAKLPYFKNCVVNTDLVSEPGASLADVLAEKAVEGSFDLVLLISRHRSGLESIFVGSQLIRTVRRCPVPMLVLSPGKLPAFNRVMYATDFSDASARVYRKLQEVADLLTIQLECVYINTMTEFKDQRQFVEARNDFLKGLGLIDLPEIHLYNAWELETGILQFADDFSADFIAVATHAKRGLSALFYNSLTETLLNDTTFPLIIFNLKSLPKDKEK